MSLNTVAFPSGASGPSMGSKTLSLENILPPPSSSARITSSVSASFNLLATVIGGGVLSLPFAYAASGLVLTTVFVLLAACMGSFSLYILCSCARRTGGVTYGDVVRRAFGPRAELGLQLTLATFLLFVVTAYMVLIRDINGSLVPLFVDPAPAPNQVLAASMVFCLPFMLQRDLHSLRYNCYVGFVSVLLLLVAIVARSLTVNVFEPTPEYPKPWDRVRSESILWTSSLNDALFSFPLVALAFLSQFNMLAVHASLANPTRARVLAVINRAILCCTVVFSLFGSAGYLYALGDTRDNILLNFRPDDPVILLGKVGLGLALMSGISMILLPCRDAILLIPSKWASSCGSEHSYARIPSETTPLHSNNSNPPQPAYLLNPPLDPTFTSFIDDEPDDDYNNNRARNLSEESLASNEELPPSSTPAHVTSTLAIAGICYFAATSVPGVSTVWSICGSSLGIIIAYILPSLCYLKIRSRKAMNVRLVGAWMLLVVSVFLMIVCTAQAVGRLMGGPIQTKASDLTDDYDDDLVRDDGLDDIAGGGGGR
ncbi:hypothetical protein TeGR_g4161 [Tetraparma gracilis]|uniref:Amino acid transporter transmembrane domain-containing protein n=1 Tax=Tetraparma gracilis TaxID=2962635 RepID=A0ABQ6MC36_9STRA|nr:hypothetical protein TeGR_g4161 [Tetraparma gracilis]